MAVFTRSAERRYNNNPQLFDRCRVGHGRTMHHQNVSELARKQTCSNACQCSCSRAKSYAAGTCQQMKITFIAIQATSGEMSQRHRRRSAGRRRSGPTTGLRTHAGSPRKSGTTGQPSSSRGGTTDIRSRCCTMCVLSNTSAKPSSGDATAIHRTASPIRK